MTFYTQMEARSAAQSFEKRSGLTASAALAKSAAAATAESHFDIFLCHSFPDAELALGAKRLLEQRSLSVYVDWINDPQADRSKVTPATAELLRTRMQACSSLVYAMSPTAPNSKWMPWELGYFDGLRGSSIAIMPLLQAKTDTYLGQEYLGLYPTIEKLLSGGRETPFVTRRTGSQREWLNLKKLGSEVKSYQPLK